MNDILSSYFRNGLQEDIVKFEVSAASQAVLFEDAIADELSSCSAANDKFRYRLVSLVPTLRDWFFCIKTKEQGTRITVRISFLKFGNPQISLNGFVELQDYSEPREDLRIAFLDLKTKSSWLKPPSLWEKGGGMRIKARVYGYTS